MPAQKKIAYSSRTFSVVKQFSTPAFYFAAANIANFMQGRNSVATGIALFNLAWVCILIGGSFCLENRPNRSPEKKYFKAISHGISDTSPTDSPTEKVFRLVGREISNPMRVTAYCALAVSAVLLVGSGGVGAALFPGLAGLFFGTGNFIQSSSKLGGDQRTFKNEPDHQRHAPPCGLVWSWLRSNRIGYRRRSKSALQPAVESPSYIYDPDWYCRNSHIAWINDFRTGHKRRCALHGSRGRNTCLRRGRPRHRQRPRHRNWTVRLCRRSVASCIGARAAQ